MSKEEQSPFLTQDSNESYDRLQDSVTTRPSFKTLSSYLDLTQKVSFAVNLLLLALCIFLTVMITLQSSSEPSFKKVCNDDISEPYSPAAAVIEYQYRPIIPNDTRFVGHPGPEWEQSMHQLMEGTLIRISEEELRQSGSGSIPLKDGGYAAGLGVGHNLHCIKKIKQFIYREHFYPNLSNDKDQFDYVQSHADHCLDFLRQDMLCHLDYSLYTLYWGERRQDIPTHRIPVVQKCVNWDKLHSWMQNRVANTEMLVRP
ncbi:hypothetical protein EV127DRAFT_394938 [Xylaria flabelliformis]|nr:hypothetical protein EV127DRAFT_394938 [Xylaria flabelliformis]